LDLRTQRQPDNSGARDLADPPQYDADASTIIMAIMAIKVLGRCEKVRRRETLLFHLLSYMKREFEEPLRVKLAQQVNDHFYYLKC
jgi:uncharacterized protein YbgA (DUF1722 family)